ATSISTQASGEIDGNAPSLISRCNVEIGPDGSFGMFTSTGISNRIEIAFSVQPRSYGAYKNGPDGNAVLPRYLDAAQCPSGITIATREAGQLIKEATLNGKQWDCLTWRNNYEKNKERTWEWSVSGTPASVASWTWATSVFKAIEAKFKAAAVDFRLGFTPNPNGPDGQMFIFARRSVLVENAAPLDEGRGSEYLDPFDILRAIGPERDFKFNRIPEVLVIDHDQKVEFPMSFHDLHLLATTSHFSFFVTPRAFKHLGKLSWDFRLICIQVLAKKQAAIAVSPSKSVRKRKGIFLDDITSDSAGSPSKKQGTAASSSSSQV
ncbi:hypothetical protein BDP27DRAFT_1336768, partial [Rhodocollybia butyracea]